MTADNIHGIWLGSMIDIDPAHYRAFGFVVIRDAFDAQRLRGELLRALDQGSRSSFGADVGAGQIQGQYVPMMSAETPHSLALLDEFQAVAATLLGGSVLPVRAKGVRYFRSTPWHADSAHEVASVGFAAYLEPLHADNGALRVVPGSHHRESGEIMRAYLASLGSAATVASLPGFPIATAPGDVIAFDEHLLHASTGGTTRCQWRVDYVCDPNSAHEDKAVHRYFADIFPPDWDGGYDVDRFPSYGAHWRESGRQAVERLRALGVYALADAQESFARSRFRFPEGA